MPHLRQHQQPHIPKVPLEQYASVVLGLAEICTLEKEADKDTYKKLHSWYLYRQSFYGFLEHIDPSDNLISLRAEKEYAKIRNDTLRGKTWAEQPSFDKGREIFHMEHVYTGHMFREAVANLPQEERTPQNIAQIIRENYRIAWILKEEDKLLPKARRGDCLHSALAMYDKVGIVLK